MFTTFRKYADPEYTNVSRNNKELLLDQTDPPVFNITLQQFNLLTQITSKDTAVTNTDAYFSGVYI
jgi:hypothetical protein